MADKGKVNYDTFVMRHGLYRNLPKGKLGEPLYCTDTHELYIGQGEDKAPIPVVAQGGSGTDVNGMFFSVDTIAERDALKYTYNIQNGAMCYVAQEDMYYKYSNGEWGEANFGTGGGGTTGSLTSEMGEDLTLSVNNDLRISYFFSSPNAGKGNLKVFINGVEVVSNSISQGAGVVTVPESAFTKGATHTLVMYVIDRAEVFTNSLTFYVTYGGLEISTTFDSASSYDVGSTIRCYYTPTSVKTLPIKLYVKIDGELQEPLSCTANTRNTYTFPRTLDAGSHNIQMWVADADGQSNVLMFPLVLLSSDSLVITSTVQNVEAEEGDQVSLDYKVSMKNQTAFNTKYYIDEVLAQTGTCGVVKTAWNTSTLTKGSHKLRLYVETQAKGDDGTTPLATASYIWDVVIVESSYQIVRPVTAGCIGMFTAQDRTNTASDKEIWVGVDEDSREVVADLYNYGYTNTNGWVDNSLISNGSSYVKIPLKPLANDGGKQGVTIDIEFSTRDVGIEDAVVLDCYDEVNDCGIRITKDKAIMKSQSGNSINLDYSQDENTHITLVLNRLDRMAMGYINGILCEAFYLSDTGEGDAIQQESFLVDDYIYLNCSHKVVEGVETFDHIGWSKIKNVRIYNIALTNEEVLQNFIANITDKDTQRAKSQFQKGATLPTMTFTGSTKGMGKGKPKTMKITYNSTDELKYGKSFELKNCSVEWQGTSSLQYVIKNYKIKLKDDSGNKYKYNPYGETEALPESTFCLKADYMESSHANNTGLAKFITKYLYQGDTIELSPPRQVYTGVRDTITGFPIRLVINDVQDNGEIITKDMGVFNFNLDKGCTDSFGLDTEKYPNCMSYEVAANSDTSAGAFFSYGYQIDENTVAGSEFDTELEYLQNSFELRYPDDKVVGSDYGYMTKLKRVIDWVCSMPVETEEQKKAFRDQFPNYFDKGYTLRYLLCVLVFGMVDNLGKNMMLDTWDGQIWYPRFYDLDTSFGLDNSGVLDIPSYCEIEAGTFNTSKSQLWTKVMIAFEKELKTEYQYMRTGKFNEANIMEFMYGEQISKIPEKYYNSDAQTKYLDFGALYLSKLHGNRYEHMKKWLRQRLLYVDTLLDYTSTTDDSITLRAGTLEQIQFEISTFNPMYVRIKWKNGYTAKYRSDGKTPFVASYKLDTETDQEILIYGGSQLKKIDGLSSAMPESMDIANASRLTKLVVHSSKLKNINGTTSGGVNISSMSNMQYVDISNCTALEGSMNVSGCSLLTYVNAQGTLMNDIQLPTSCASLQEIWYPKAVQTVSVQNMAKLKVVGLQPGHSIKTLNISNCPSLEALGDREFNAQYSTYKYDNAWFLSGVQDLTLDNTLLNETELGVRFCTNLKSIKVYNIPNLQTIKVGTNTHNRSDTYVDNANGIVKYLFLEKIPASNDLKVVSTNCPKLENFYITGDHRKNGWEEYQISYNVYTNLKYYMSINPSILDDGDSPSDANIQDKTSAYAVFRCNILDLSGTKIKNVECQIATQMTGMKIPTTVKHLVIMPKMAHKDVYDYKVNFTGDWDSRTRRRAMYGEVFGNESWAWSIPESVANYQGYKWRTGFPFKDSPTIVSNIWVDIPANADFTPDITVPIWNFDGVTLDDLGMYQMYIWVGNNGFAADHMSGSLFPTLRNNMTLKNLVLNCKEYAPNLHDFTTLENVKIDFTNFVGEAMTYSLANITEEVDLTFPTNVDNFIANIKYLEKPFCKANTSKVGWDFVEKLYPYLQNGEDLMAFRECTLREQTDYDTDGIYLNNAIISHFYVQGEGNNSSLTNSWFYGSNLKYVKGINLKNTCINNMFFRSGLVKVGDINLGVDGEDVYYRGMHSAFAECENLVSVGNITLNENNYRYSNRQDNAGNSGGSFYGAFKNNPLLETVGKIKRININKTLANDYSYCMSLEDIFNNCPKLTGIIDLTEIGEVWYMGNAFRQSGKSGSGFSVIMPNTNTSTGGISEAFLYYTFAQAWVTSIDFTNTGLSGMTNMNCAFSECEVLTELKNLSIPSSVTNMDGCYYKTALTSVPMPVSLDGNCTFRKGCFDCALLEEAPNLVEGFTDISCHIDQCDKLLTPDSNGVLRLFYDTPSSVTHLINTGNANEEGYSKSITRDVKDLYIHIPKSCYGLSRMLYGSLLKGGTLNLHFDWEEGRDPSLMMDMNWGFTSMTTKFYNVDMNTFYLRSETMGMWGWWILYDMINEINPQTYVDNGWDIWFTRGEPYDWDVFATNHLGTCSEGTTVKIRIPSNKYSAMNDSIKQKMIAKGYTLISV